MLLRQLAAWSKMGALRSTLWRPFDVRLSFDTSSGLPAAGPTLGAKAPPPPPAPRTFQRLRGCRGAAFARIILCPSALCNPTAGLPQTYFVWNSRAVAERYRAA